MNDKTRRLYFNVVGVLWLAVLDFGVLIIYREVWVFIYTLVMFAISFLAVWAYSITSILWCRHFGEDNAQIYIVFLIYPITLFVNALFLKLLGSSWESALMWSIAISIVQWGYRLIFAKSLEDYPGMCLRLKC